jgi:2-oxoglutarate ferredoxin oxidoreductase subunit alpha
VIHASHGEFPRAVFAPGNAEEAFYLASKAFNMADRYQTPVIVMGDQYLNDSFFTIEPPDLSQIEIDRGSMLSRDSAALTGDYLRYAWDDSGVSPRILPGQSATVQYADSDEHTEAGHITEDAAVRKRLMDKRMRKLDGIRAEMGCPRTYPKTGSDIVLLGWGSTQGAVREAVEILNREGLRTQMLQFSEVYPFPGKVVLEAISTDAKILAVENNYTGQFADLFHFETGLPIFHKILKYDGRPFSAMEIATRVKEAL